MLLGRCTSHSMSGRALGNCTSCLLGWEVFNIKERLLFCIASFPCSYLTFEPSRGNLSIQCSVGEQFYLTDATGLRLDLAAVREKDERSDKTLSMRSTNTDNILHNFCVITIYYITKYNNINTSYTTSPFQGLIISVSSN